MFVWLDLFGILLLAAPISLVAFGLITTMAWSRNGGIAQGFAQLVVDPVRVQRFLVYVGVVIISFLGLGVLVATQILLDWGSDLLTLAISVCFLIGCVGLFLLMMNGLPRGDLNLEQSLNLQADNPGIMTAVESAQGSGRPFRPGTMYVVPPTSRAEGHTEPNRTG
jgi:hypothetical protein